MTFQEVIDSIHRWVQIHDGSTDAEERREARQHLLMLDKVRKDMVYESMRREAPNQMCVVNEDAL